MAALFSMDDRLDQHLGFMGSPHKRMAHNLAAMDHGRCREVAVSGFRSLSADAGADGQKTAQGDGDGDFDELSFQFDDVTTSSRHPPEQARSRGAVESSKSHAALSPAQKKPPSQHRRNKSIGVPSEAAPFTSCGLGYIPRHFADHALPGQQYSPKRPGCGGSATDGPVRVLSPREVRARELGLGPETKPSAAQGYYGSHADSLQHRLSREETSKEGGEGREERGPPAEEPTSALSSLGAAESPWHVRDRSSVVARYQSPSLLHRRGAQVPAGQSPGSDVAQQKKASPTAEDCASGGHHGSRLPLSTRRGAVVPQLSTPPHRSRSSPQKDHDGSQAEMQCLQEKTSGAPLTLTAGTADLEPPPIKVGPGLRAALARGEQRSPSRPNCPLPSAPRPGCHNTRQLSPWRSPKMPSPGGPSLNSSPGGGAPAHDSNHTGCLPAGTSSGELLPVKTPLRAPFGPQSLHASPVSSPARRRAPATGGSLGGGVCGGTVLSAFQLDLIATAAANPVASSPKSTVQRSSGAVGHTRTSSVSLEGGTGESLATPVGLAAGPGGHRRSPSFEGGAYQTSAGEPPVHKLASSASTSPDAMLLCNRSLSPMNTARSGSGERASIPGAQGLNLSARSRFGPAAHTVGEGGFPVGKGQGMKQQMVAGGQEVVLRRSQHANAIDSAAFHAKRAAIRKGVRDLQQAQKQRMHRRGASFAAAGGEEELDLYSSNPAVRDHAIEPVAPGLDSKSTECLAGSEGADTEHRGAKLAKAPMPAQHARPVLGPFSKYRHSWGNEPDFLKSNPLSQDSIPGEGERMGKSPLVELMADYSFKRGHDLAKMLQQGGVQGTAGAGTGQGQQREAAQAGDAAAAPRTKHRPRHSMDLGKAFFLAGLEFEHEHSSAAAEAVQRKGSCKGADDALSSARREAGMATHALAHSPQHVLRGLGRAGLTPRDHVLGQPYDDVTRLYAMHRLDLGAGQFGVVRKCKDARTGHVYACKSIRKESIRCQEDADDIRKEVACMKLLHAHPRFVSLHAAVEDKDHVHLIMDLCQGGDLLDRITEKGPLPEAHAARMCIMLVEALLHCHCLGIVHRDVKPENILLTSNDAGGADMKLVDFGVSTFVKPGQKLKEIIGTPEYMAPEMLHLSYGPEADIWSAGVVLYVALTSVPPFWASDRQSLTESILGKEVRFKASRWSAVSEECKDLVRRMLVKDPANRIKATDVLRHPWILKHCTP